MKINHRLIRIISAIFVIFSTIIMVGYGYGGGGSTGMSTSNIDPYSNIAKYEVAERNLVINQSVEYPFITPEFGIYQILVYGKENEYSVSVRVEDLKNTSKYAKKPALGIVYKNENIWLGSTRIKYIGIRFRVKNSWLEDNGINDSRFPYLLKWDGTTWLVLKTNVTGKDDTYTYLESSKAGNSKIGIFAISAPKKVSRTVSDTSKNVTIEDQYEEVIPKIEEMEIKNKGAPTGLGIIAVIIGGIIVSTVYMTRKRMKK